jgi:polyisoprenoid-binding protein YceI
VISAQQQVGHYILDKGASRFTVRAFASGMLSALGHNPEIAIRDFSGEANFDPAVPGEAAMKIMIRADSLEVMDEIKSKDRKEIESTMNRNMLESSRYPEIHFESTQATSNELGGGRYRIAMSGNLSLRGATRSLPLTVQISVIGDMLRANGEFSILQSDYGIPPVRVAGGALKLKDELKFAFDIVARKQDGNA